MVSHVTHIYLHIHIHCRYIYFNMYIRTCIDNVVHHLQPFNKTSRSCRRGRRRWHPRTMASSAASSRCQAPCSRIRRRHTLSSRLLTRASVAICWRSVRRCQPLQLDMYCNRQLGRHSKMCPVPTCQPTRSASNSMRARVQDASRNSSSSSFFVT